MKVDFMDAFAVGLGAALVGCFGLEAICSISVLDDAPELPADNALVLPSLDFVTRFNGCP